MRKIQIAIMAAALVTAAQVSQAAYVFAEWNTTDMNSYVNGTLNGVGVHYAGQVAGSTQVGNAGTQYWTEYGHDLPYTPVTGILPTRTDIVTLSDVGSHKITFDKPVLNPVMLICSLGQPNEAVSYSFDQPATVLNAGWSYWNQVTGNLGSLTQSGSSVVVGQEGAGVIGFSGWISEITWTTDRAEYWHGITLAAVPEPTTMIAGALLLLPFGASTLRMLRRRTA